MPGATCNNYWRGVENKFGQAAGQGDDDPDDPKAGDGKGVKFSERL